jgi:hypothetical protein
MENKNDKLDESELSEFSGKILLGMRKAIRKLVEESAALDSWRLIRYETLIKNRRQKGAGRIVIQSLTH